jgi:hypothetical protein
MSKVAELFDAFARAGVDKVTVAFKVEGGYCCEYHGVKMIAEKNNGEEVDLEDVLIDDQKRHFNKICRTVADTKREEYTDDQGRHLAKIRTTVADPKYADLGTVIFDVPARKIRLEVYDVRVLEARSLEWSPEDGIFSPTFFLSIEDGRLIIYRYDDGTSHDVTPITSVDDYWKYVDEQAKRYDVEDLDVRTLSSIDFADEYTKDKNVLALAGLFTSGFGTM